MSFDLSDDEGYTAHVTVATPVTNWSSSIANASPGFTDLSTSLALQAEIANTTPGRNSDWSFQYEVHAAFPATSPVCQLGEEYSKTNRIALLASAAHCYLTLGVFAGDGLPLAPDEIVNLEPGGVLAGDPTKVAFTPVSANLPNVSEELAQPLLDALDSPDGFLVGVSRLREGGATDSPAVCTTTPESNVSGIMWHTDFVAVSDIAACG